MSTSLRAKRALIAYSVLAEKLRKPGASLTSAMTPFWAEVCAQFSGELFDAAKFAQKAEEMYGFKIPRLAVLGMTEQLADERLILVKTRSNNKTVYEYPKKAQSLEEQPVNPLTEREVLNILAAFVQHARTDESLNELSDEALHDEFLERLLHLDSMKILARKDLSIKTKKTASTLTLEKSGPVEDKAQLHLDFLVSEFLLNLRDNSKEDFEKVSDIAFANMAAEAVTSFNEPTNAPQNLSGLTVYLDTPLLLDILGVNSEYTLYGEELLSLINESGASAAVMDHCIDEAESAVYAQLNYLRTGANATSYNLGTTCQPDLLAALYGNIAERVHTVLKLDIHPKPNVELHKSHSTTVGNIEAEMERRMQSWRNTEAKDYDRRSVWTILSIQDTSTIIRNICDTKSILLSRNTALVSIANDAWKTWLKETTRHSHARLASSAPIALSDKQFAGYLWTRSTNLSTDISKTRLLAHCSAAIRPRADVKARTYNLVLELSGEEAATYVMALIDDREGALGLMKATRGDPEDVTPERLPYIIEQVKLEAGEFAAARERKKAEEEISNLREQFINEKTNIDLELATTKEDLRRQSAEISQAREELEALNREKIKHEHDTLRQGLKAGCRMYRVVRWGVAIMFGAATAFGTHFSQHLPSIASALLTLTISIFGFWFVPSILNKPVFRLAKWAAKRKVASLNSQISWPGRADFLSRSLILEDGQKITLPRKNASTKLPIEPLRDTQDN